MDSCRKLAKDVFHQPPESLNCAQSVAKIAGRNDLIPEYKAFGGGRAEGGLCGALCGALYAALQIVPDSSHDNILDLFQKNAGALTCKEIKSGSKTPCLECVALGAWLIQNDLEKKNDLE
ncbi:MAG: C-GCAxxG-C-C family (seleno)protein, partial [Planctomycetia bacterium]|nr:C-GCAxxG-C-C family (seleno)protein [Planctomycetia bacterium]